MNEAESTLNKYERGHIVIEVRDGLIQAVYADCIVDVDVADLDAEDDLDHELALAMLDKANKPGWRLVW